MKGFPNQLKTRSDIINTFKLCKKGKLDSEDWFNAIEKLENTNYIWCPVIELSEDRKTIKVLMCNEAAEGQEVKAGNVTCTIKSLATEIIIRNRDGEIVDEKTDETNEITYTLVTVSKAVAAATETIGIQACETFYDRMGITKEEIEEMKGELA